MQLCITQAEVKKHNPVDNLHTARQNHSTSEAMLVRDVLVAHRAPMEHQSSCTTPQAARGICRRGDGPIRPSSTTVLGILQLAKVWRDLL